MTTIHALIFDWGDTLMQVWPEQAGPMVEWPQVALIPGVRAALESLAGRYLCCVASNAGDSDAELLAQALDRVHIAKFFDHLWTSKELGATKPNTAFFSAVLAKLALPAGACVMIGDSYEKDITPARRLGMRTIWLTPSTPEDAPAADAIAHSMDALPAALEALAP